MNTLSNPTHSSISSYQSGAPFEKRLDIVLDRWVSTQYIVGCVVLVARDGQLIYHRAMGLADREQHLPVTEGTLFRHASITKLITSVTALALIEEGRLSLDDHVADWLTYFTPPLPDGRRPDITIRQLMTHTSGLSYVFFEEPGNAYARAGIPQGLTTTGGTLEDAMRSLASVPLFYEPGTQWRYSLSTDVLGAVIENASGMPLPLAVERYVTGPLGMEKTVFHVTDPDCLATAYRDGDDCAERLNDDFDEIPLGPGVIVSPDLALRANAYPSGGVGMSGTAEEILFLLETLRQGGAPILSPNSVSMLTSHAIGDLRAWTEGEGWGFGHGVAVLLDPTAAATPQSPGTWQWGGALGSHYFVDPVKKLSVVVLTNTSVAGVIGDFPAEIREALYSQ